MPSYTGLTKMTLHKYGPTDDYYLQKKVKDGKVYYHKRNRERHKACVRKYRQKARLKVLMRLGGKCVRCGFDDPRALQIDHINGDAKNDPNARYRDGSSHGSLLIFNLVHMSDQELKSCYQLLCANCNWIKRHENKEWGTGGLGKKW